MRIIFRDVEAKRPLCNARSSASLKKFLAQADIVTFHVPGGKSTQNIIDAQAIAAIKPGSILVNASRGTVLDTDALHAALASGHLSGAALDVFATEKKSVIEPFATPLLGIRHVILTHHLGGTTQQSQVNNGRHVAKN